MTVSRVQRDDYNRASAFVWRIDMQLDKPDLATERGSIDRSQSVLLPSRELSHREFAPLRVLRSLIAGQSGVVVGNRL